MADRTVLVFGCSSPRPHGRDQMRRVSGQARRRGLRVVGVDTPANLDAMVRPELVDDLVPLQVHEPGAARAWAAGVSGVDAVLTFREMCVESVAAVADELGLAGISPAAAHTIRNKDLCREALRAAGFRQPRCALAADADSAVRFLAKTPPGPWIVKPRAGVGSEGVSLVDGPASLGTAMRRLTPGVPFLVETCVDGSEFSAEGVLRDGSPIVLALAAKTIDDRFMATAHRIPAELDEGTARAARADVERALRTVGVTHGVFHVEFWVDGAGVVLGEIHARPGGEFIHSMVEHCRTGLELYGTLIDDLRGNPASPLPELTAAAGSEFIVLPPGVVRAVHGWSRVRTDPLVLAAVLAVRAGERIRSQPPGSPNRHGVLVVGDTDPRRVEATLRRLMRTLRIDIG